MVFLLAVSLGWQGLTGDPPVAGRELAITTKPVALVKGIHPSAIVNVTEYTSKNSIFVTRVFRYIYRADYAKTVRMFERELPRKEGWRSAAVSKTETDFWRVMQKGELAQQGLIIQATRLVRDKKSPSGWSPLPPAQGKGWVWISYNEQMRPSSK